MNVVFIIMYKLVIIGCKTKEFHAPHVNHGLTIAYSDTKLYCQCLLLKSSNDNEF